MVIKTPAKINEMFDKISEHYDFYNNIISIFTHKLIKRKAIEALNIQSDSKVLDLCCGSGDLGQIVKSKYPKSNIIGLDNSQQMLEIAKKKNNNITYILGDAVNLPFADNSFDYIVMGFGLRNIENYPKAISEIFRVLTTNGKILHLDFGEHNIFAKIYDFLLLIIIGLFFKNKDSYRYLIKSKSDFFTPYELIRLFEKQGFKCLEVNYYLLKIISSQIFIK